MIATIGTLASLGFSGLALASSAHADSPPVSITGTVTDPATNQPVVGASVFLDPSYASVEIGAGYATTDAAGRFTIVFSDPSTFTVTGSHVLEASGGDPTVNPYGYGAARQTVTLTPGANSFHLVTGPENGLVNADVTDDTGHRVAGVCIGLYQAGEVGTCTPSTHFSGGGGFASSATSATVFGPLPPGHYELFAASSPYDPAVPSTLYPSEMLGAGFTVVSGKTVDVDRQLPADPLSFPDVPMGSTFAPDVSFLAVSGITAGYTDGTFRPTTPVSRQAFAAYLYRLEHGGSDAGPCAGAAPFNDVSAASPFCGDIAALAGAGVIAGFPDGTFAPTASISRQAIAALLFRLAHQGADAGVCTTGTFAPGFPDVPSSSPFCGDIAWLGQTTPAPISSSYGGFRPADPLSRQAAAAFLHRYNQDTAT